MSEQLLKFSLWLLLFLCVVAALNRLGEIQEQLDRMEARERDERQRLYNIELQLKKAMEAVDRAGI